jgi:non-ribosomal peptide synthetase component F
MTEQLEYWGKQLGEAEALELPPDYPRQPLQDHHSAWISFTLPAKLTKALQELSWREGATLFMTLLAGYQLLLSQYSGQERVLVGTPIANRNLVETENLIGFFANSLALRTDLGGDPSVQELLKRVRDVTLGAYGHQEIPFEKLIEELQPDRDLRCNPVFRVMFSLQNGPVSKLELPGLRLSAAITPGDSAKFEISIFIRGLRDSLQINAEYAADLFSDATIRQMLQQHLVKVYEAMVANPAQRISEISLFSEDEQQALAAQNEI